jgi:Phage integrase family
MVQIRLQKTPRLKLAVRKKPYWQEITPGLALGYRRNIGPGAWVVRVADGSGGNWTKGFAVADDVDSANDNTVMDYDQALIRARKLAGADRSVSTDRPVTVDEAVDAYEVDLETRGGDPQNARSIRFYLAGHPALRAAPVSLLKKKDLKDWRDSIVVNGKVKPDTANRVCRVFKAALTLAASYDERITNINAWKQGLKSLPKQKDDESVSRDLILDGAMIGAFVKEGYRDGDDIGRWFQVLAETGARESQICRLLVDDLQDDRGATRLMMPSSRKGRNREIERKPVPISRQLFQQLKQATAGKRSDEPIFTKRTHIERDFRAISESLRAPPQAVPYSFRHSSIVRMLVKDVPLSIVASHHDTSAKIIQKHYARFISNVSDAVTRNTLPEFEMPKNKIARIGKAA